MDNSTKAVITGILMAFMVVNLFALIFFSLSIEDQEEYEMPDFVLQADLPSDYSELHNLDFRYDDTTTFTVTIENVSDSLSILLETREPYVEFEYGSIDLYHETKIFINGVPASHHRTINTGDTIRHIWDISGLQPNTDYTFEFLGEGQCGRFVDRKED